MKRAALVAQMLIRLCGVLLILLGGLLWSGRGFALLPLHVVLGLVLVLALWTLAGVGAAFRLRPGLLIAVGLWGLLVLVLGMAQVRLVPGHLHWIVQVVHLLVGIGAMGMGERIGGLIKRAAPAAA